MKPQLHGTRFRGAVQVTMGFQCVAYAGLVPVLIRLR